MLSQLCLVMVSCGTSFNRHTLHISFSYWIENVNMCIVPVLLRLLLFLCFFSLPYRLPDFNANASLIYIWTQRVQVLYSWAQTHAGSSVETIGNCFSRPCISFALYLFLSIFVRVCFFFCWMQFRNFHYIFGWYCYWLGMLFLECVMFDRSKLCKSIWSLLLQALQAFDVIQKCITIVLDSFSPFTIPLQMN